MASVLVQWDQDPHPDLRGVVVLRNGRLVAQRYYNGADPAELHDVRSAGKSVTALLLGIAIDRRAIRSVDDPVERYWPAARDSAVGPVALRDLLTMRSGLAANDDDPASPGNEDRLDEAPDPLKLLLTVPRAESAGARYNYNSLTAYAAGVVVAEATRTRMDRFAERHLFAPLGIEQWRWDSDASGVTKGQGNLRLSTRSLAAIGEMVRNGGRAEGRQVISAHWIAEMLKPRVGIADADPFADGYGYFWYSKTYQIAGHDIRISFGSGNGGNKVYVVPACRLTVAITSAAYGRGYGQRRSEAILKAILAAEVAAGSCGSAS
jgi:CubicO group peptidase (beta-lactamase class C family)